jgi:hypothetical protein
MLKRGPIPVFFPPSAVLFIENKCPITKGIMMSSTRIFRVSLCLAGFAFTGNSLANQQEEEHQWSVTMVAMEQVCNKTNPGLNGDVENAMASDPKIDEAKKSQVRKIKSDPSYKLEVASITSTILKSPLAAMAQDMCKEYAPK